MEYHQLGNSDLNVSRICLGCMGFGNASGMQNWALGFEDSEKIIKHALDLGINFFDTANCYSNGSSEEFLGRAINKLTSRDKVIIATKVYFNEGKSSKEAIHREVEKSLKRLNTNYIDLLIIHRFDYSTPISETMDALNEVIKEGKVRYIGASAMYAYQFAKMQDYARYHNLNGFASMQDRYNLIYREEEREMMKLLKEENVSSTPYSPLAGGRLSRLWDANTNRSKIDNFAIGKYDSTKDIDLPIVKRAYELSLKYNVPQSAISLAWLLSKDRVASVLLGATKEKYIDDAIKSFDVKLTTEDTNYLEELYVPHKVVGALDKGENI
ncbi:MAG: aldo/keto reductase [Firmicutes bacterium]|uniref:Aldo/keto reductase n=1 Tax=Candidatus Onthovivens merdipullorum TaxID=2840889 RepID=A0A9D9GWQ4_9BACL|nr:aldo/keto reductase [Candidatus Onthovivens merdipullorum]